MSVLWQLRRRENTAEDHGKYDQWPRNYALDFLNLKSGASSS